jgi:S-DNA-T family DNA segregation ATPase FtsK/SpoIIIE
MGKPVWMEINKTPHLLVAGTTGSGKSVCINSIIVSILMRTKPNEVKLVLIDPKKVEFAMYEDIPHLLVPVVTNAKKANEILKKVVVEMEERYERFKDTGTKNIAGYNAYVEKRNENSSSKMAKMPFMVVIIDELADLMLVAAKEVEDSIMRITQMARAAGIHLIVATQRPSTDVITGVVKANIPSRISFAVSSNIDSRTILDMVGAEKLIGKGDMLYKPQGENTPIRIQGTFITDQEIENVVNYVKKEQPVVYDKKMSLSDEEQGATTLVENISNDATEEPLYNEIVEFVVEQGKASSSLIQRRFHLGYNRAARVIDLLEERGIVGPATGSSKPREVLVGVKNSEEDVD